MNLPSNIRHTPSLLLSSGVTWTERQKHHAVYTFCQCWGWKAPWGWIWVIWFCLGTFTQRGRTRWWFLEISKPLSRLGRQRQKTTIRQTCTQTHTQTQARTHNTHSNGILASSEQEGVPLLSGFNWGVYVCIYVCLSVYKREREHIWWVFSVGQGHLQWIEVEERHSRLLSPWPGKWAFNMSL